jgi:tetratricopeptide (TPR) repeat protein
MAEWDAAFVAWHCILLGGSTKQGRISSGRCAIPRRRHFDYRAMAAHNLGKVFLARSQYAEAEDWFRSSLSLGRPLDDELVRANTLGALAETFMAQRRVKEACDLYDEALTLLVKYPDDAWARKLRAEFQEQRDLLSKPYET